MLTPDSPQTTPNPPTVLHSTLSRSDGCESVPNAEKPIIVESPGVDLAGLAEATRRGLVVVSYDCRQLSILAKCNARGTYSDVFNGLHTDTIPIQDDEQLHVKLPLASPNLLDSVRGGRSLALDYATAVQRVASHSPDAPVGDCAGATHWVRSLTLGAYRLRRLARQGFASHPDSASTDANHDESSAATKRDTFEECVKHGGIGTACEAIIRIDLAQLPIGGAEQAGFGAAIGNLAPVAIVEPPPRFEPSGPLGVADLEFNRRADKAMRIEMSKEATPQEKVEAWDAVAKYEGIRAEDKKRVEQRRDEWTQAIRNEALLREQGSVACVNYQNDIDKIVQLLSSAAVTAAQKEAYKEEFARKYDRWEEAIEPCLTDIRVQCQQVLKDKMSGEMARIPSGEFAMGEERKASAVEAFDLDVSEVTLAAYERCMRDGKCTEPHPGLGCNWGTAKSNHPINCVDVYQAQAYCAWANKSLPSEKQWEYAARGADGRIHPWGQEPPARQACWKPSIGHGHSSTCDVGSHTAGDSPFGLHDMAGNVWEWTSSTLGPKRILRGGAWSSFDPFDLRVTSRDVHSSTYRGSTVGFRCSRQPAVEPKPSPSNCSLFQQREGTR